MIAADSLYKGFRFPEEIISHAVWWYYRFLLSLRDVQELLLERGVVVSHETIRAWCERFGPDYARRLRGRRPRPGDRGHLDEVFVKINGKQHYLWRAVDQHGNMLDVLVQARRNARAAERFFRKLLKGLERVPRVIVTDKLASYEVAHRRCPRSSTAARSTSTAPRTRINRPGGVSGLCNGPSHTPTRSGSSPCSARYHRTSGHADTCCPRTSTDR